MDFESENWAIDIDIGKIMHDFGVVKEKYSQILEDRNKFLNVIKSLKIELNKVQEAEKLQRESLDSSRKLITDQQSIISKVVNLNEEIKYYKEELSLKEKYIKILEQEKSEFIQKFQNEKKDMKLCFDENIQQLKTNLEKERNQLQNQYDIYKYEAELIIEEKKNILEEHQLEKEEQLNITIRDYEIQLQGAHSEISQLRNEIELNKKHVEDLEEKLNAYNNNKSNNNMINKYNNILINKENSYSDDQRSILSTKTSIKSNRTFYSPLQVEIKDYNQVSNPIPPQIAVKPVRRKLFNKDVEYFESNDSN